MMLVNEILGPGVEKINRFRFQDLLFIVTGIWCVMHKDMGTQIEMDFLA